MSRKFVVINVIPSARDLTGFDYFPDIPIGTILDTGDSLACIMYNGMNVCDINSKWEKKYLQEIV